MTAPEAVVTVRAARSIDSTLSPVTKVIRGSSQTDVSRRSSSALREENQFDRCTRS